MSRGSTARRCRQEKETHPERYCRAKECLWRVQTRDGYKACPKHSNGPARTSSMEPRAAEAS